MSESAGRGIIHSLDKALLPIAGSSNLWLAQPPTYHGGGKQELTTFNDNGKNSFNWLKTSCLFWTNITSIISIFNEYNEVKMSELGTKISLPYLEHILKTMYLVFNVT